MRALPTLSNNLLFVVFISIIGALSDCVGTQAALKHRYLETKTQLSDTIFLDPVLSNNKNIYIAVKNNSDQNTVLIKQLKMVLSDHGYNAINNPLSAHYILQVNVLTRDDTLILSQKLTLKNYRSLILNQVKDGDFESKSVAKIREILGCFLGVSANYLVKNMSYTMITDVQISERIEQSIKVEKPVHKMLEYIPDNTLQYQRYRTQIISIVDKDNLSLHTARVALEDSLVRTLVGIF